MRRLTAFSLNHPRVAIALWVAVTLACAAFALRLDSALSGGGFSNPRAEALITQESVQKTFGDAPNQVLIQLESSGTGTISPADLASVSDTLTEFGASTVTDSTTNPALQSESGTASLVLGGFPGDNTSVQNLTEDLQERLNASFTGDVTAYVTGQPALDFQLNKYSKQDATRAEMIVFPLLLVILLLVFRSLAATALPLIIAGVSLGIANGVGFLITQATDLSNLYTNIVSMIGLAVAVDYSLFIIKRFREELDLGVSARQSVEKAVETAGHSVLFSGAAVILALSALFIPRVMSFTSIALGGIVVTAVALAAATTLLPALLVVLGKQIDWGQVLKRKPVSEAGTPAASGAKNGGRALTGASRATKIVSKHPGIIAVLSILVMAALAVPIKGISLQSPVASASVLPASDTARIGLELARDSIGDSNLFPTQVILTFPRGTTTETALEATDTATKFAQSLAHVSSVSSATSLGLTEDTLNQAPQLWHSTEAAITARLFVAPTEGPDSVAAHDVVRELRAQLPAQLAEMTQSEVSVAVTGATAQGLDFDDTLVDSLPIIAGAVFLLTFILLAFAFRSLILPILALCFNTLVVGASVGLLTAIQSAISNEPLNSVTPVLLFAVMFGLSMDYMVIIIARMTEAYRSGMSYQEAVSFGSSKTRAMINSAALIMVTVFLAFMTGQISIVREIGIGLAIAVTLDALVIRMVVMPSVLLALGPRVFGKRTSSSSEARTPGRSDTELVDA